MLGVFKNENVMDFQCLASCFEGSTKMKTEMNFAMNIEIGTFLFSTRFVSVCDATKQF